MSGLTSGELATMRAALLDLLPDTCSILSGTVAISGEGEESITWGTVNTSVSCRIDPIRQAEQMAGGGLQAYSRYTLTVPYNTTLTSNGRVVVGTITYAVVSVMASNSWALDKRAIVEKV